MSNMEQLIAKLRVKASVFHNGHYCGNWAVDTSGSKQMTFHLVTHGRCFLEFNGEKKPIESGDAVFFPNDAQHMLCTAQANAETVNTAQASSMLEPMSADSVALVCGCFEPLTPVFNSISEYFPDVILLPRQSNSDSAALIDLMIAEARNSGQSNTALLDRYADCLFYLLLRDHLPDDQGLFAAMQHPKLTKAISLVQAEGERLVSLQDMADAAGMSRSSFAALFKEVVGQTPNEFATQWRMTQAYEWLSVQGVTTLEAAIRSGYENEASFSKAFKRVMGVGPGAVRAGH